MTGSSSARHTPAGTKTFPESPSGERTAQRAATQGSRERIEPRMEDYGMPSDAYERLHGIEREFGEYRPPQRGRLSRLTVMVSVFILGAGVGLAAAWWLYSDPPFAAIPASQVRSIPLPPAADAQRPPTARGISPGELPYDGAPPPTAAESAIDDRPAIAVQGGEAAASVDASGDSAADADEVRTVESSAERDAETEPPKAAAATTRNPVVKSADRSDEAKAARPAAQGSAGVASAVPKRKNVPRSDREIERIRQQAEDELKKKTEHGRGPGESPPGAKQGARDDDRAGNRASAREAPIARVAATRSMLARCERSDNFIRREICRWQVCNGSWGKNGCPSYQQQTPTY